MPKIHDILLKTAQKLSDIETWKLAGLAFQNRIEIQRIALSKDPYCDILKMRKSLFLETTIPHPTGQINSVDNLNISRITDENNRVLCFNFTSSRTLAGRELYFKYLNTFQDKYEYMSPFYLAELSDLLNLANDRHWLKYKAASHIMSAKATGYFSISGDEKILEWNKKKGILVEINNAPTVKEVLKKNMYAMALIGETEEIIRKNPNIFEEISEEDKKLLYENLEIDNPRTLIGHICKTILNINN